MELTDPRTLDLRLFCFSIIFPIFFLSFYVHCFDHQPLTVHFSWFNISTVNSFLNYNHQNFRVFGSTICSKSILFNNLANKSFGKLFDVLILSVINIDNHKAVFIWKYPFGSQDSSISKCSNGIIPSIKMHIVSVANNFAFK